MTYTITLTAKQVATLSEACELLARLDAGQVESIADYLPAEGFRHSDIVQAVDEFGKAIEPNLTPEIRRPAKRVRLH